MERSGAPGSRGASNSSNSSDAGGATEGVGFSNQSEALLAPKLRPMHLLARRILLLAYPAIGYRILAGVKLSSWCPRMARAFRARILIVWENGLYNGLLGLGKLPLGWRSIEVRCYLPCPLTRISPCG